MGRDSSASAARTSAASSASAAKGDLVAEWKVVASPLASPELLLLDAIV